MSSHEKDKQTAEYEKQAKERDEKKHSRRCRVFGGVK